jgi:hypothetical protein
MLRGRWCHIIVLNIRAPTEVKIDYVKDSVYEQRARVFDKYQKHHMKILLGDWNAKVDREDIFKPTNENERVQEISNDKGVTVVNFATSKNLTVTT